MIEGVGGATLEAFAEGFATGLVGTLGVTIDDGDGNNVLPRTTADIIEIDTVDGFGVYRYLGTFPATIGTYLITWDDGDITGSETIQVVSALPSPGAQYPLGPCEPWVTALDVADCCGLELGSDTEEALELAAGQASDVLFYLSGSQYRGLCGPVTVRPCRNRSTCYIPGRHDPVRACGCAPLSTVLLPGYPVVEVAEVKIDGDVQPPSEYRLDAGRKLVRLAASDGGQQWWPSCQRLDLADTEERTFAVTYYYGIAPPQMGVSAAAQLACELYRACVGTTGECAIPSNATRVTRQGVTIERDNLTAFLQSKQTGLVNVDAFLSAFGADGATRRPAIWSPDGPRYAQQIGS